MYPVDNLKFVVNFDWFLLKMEVEELVHTSSLKCGEDLKHDNTPDVVITAPPAIPPVVIQPLPDLSLEPVLAPLPADGGVKRKIPQNTQTQAQMSSSSSSTSSSSLR